MQMNEFPEKIKKLFLEDNKAPFGVKKIERIGNIKVEQVWATNESFDGSPYHQFVYQNTGKFLYGDLYIIDHKYDHRVDVLSEERYLLKYQTEELVRKERTKEITSGQVLKYLMPIIDEYLQVDHHSSVMRTDEYKSILLKTPNYIIIKATYCRHPLASGVEFVYEIDYDKTIVNGHERKLIKELKLVCQRECKTMVNEIINFRKLIDEGGMSDLEAYDYNMEQANAYVEEVYGNTPTIDLLTTTYKDLALNFPLRFKEQ